MRYVRPREFRHNPRQPIAELDAIVQTFEKARFTFDEAGFRWSSPGGPRILRFYRALGERGRS